MNPKNFLKAPIYTNFEGGVRAEKPQFLVKIFQKKTKDAFVGLFFFQNFACGAEILAKTGTKKCFGRVRKINSVDLKKSRQKTRSFIENPPPSRKS